VASNELPRNRHVVERLSQRGPSARPCEQGAGYYRRVPIITRVRCFRQFQPLRDGVYTMSHGSSEGLDSVVVALETEEGVTGWGEMACISSFYADAFASGARAGVADLAPLLLQLDAGQPRAVLAHLDRAMRGQAYVKSAVDMACWDAAARAAGRPLYAALGARFGDSVELYNVVTVGTPDEAVARTRELLDRGYRRLQVKVGQDPLLDAERLRAVREVAGDDVVLFADANGGFTTAAVLRFLAATEDLDYTLEQPCASYDECRQIRPACRRPLILDESIETLRDLLRAHHDGVADGITVKVSRVGGVSRAALIRDVAVELGVAVTVEDGGGASIATAAIVQVSLGTPERLRMHTCDFHNWVTVDNADGLPDASDGRLAPPSGPGLGVTVRADALGEPFVDLAV
jgi:L-alanine-DL-glutamate epimerase-like enolase superfamily enzyme